MTNEELEREIAHLKSLLNRAARALDYYKHDSGCPAIADDESDYKYLDDAGECVCRARKSDADEIIVQLRKATE